MTLIVLTCTQLYTIVRKKRFSGYYLKGKNCWELNFSMNLSSKNMLWQFYSKKGNHIPQKLLIVKISGKKKPCLL